MKIRISKGSAHTLAAAYIASGQATSMRGALLFVARDLKELHESAELALVGIGPAVGSVNGAVKGYRQAGDALVTVDDSEVLVFDLR